jgi:lipoprotein NlpI
MQTFRKYLGRKSRLAIIIAACLLSTQTACVHAQENLQQAGGLLQSAGDDLAAKKYEDAARKAIEAAELAETSGRVQQTAAEVLFLAGKPEASLPLFDRANALLTANAPHNWQRGIALGCCGKWSDGAKQFKQHQDVNPDDVENSAWYFLCVAKSEGVPAAKASVIPSRGDSRQPMMAVLQMLMGEKKPEEVLAAAASSTPEGPRRKQAMFYGELYVGLYYDSIGEAIEAGEHLRASLNYDQAHYMADTARVYLQHRFPNPTKPSKPTDK